MSWGTELWDQLDNISTHTQKGIDFCEKYGQFIKDRCAIESEYALKLKKLAKNYLPKSEKGDKRKDDEFSSHRGFCAMVKEVNDLAGQHEAKFENFSNVILKDLQTAIIEAKQERKRLLMDASKQQIVFQNQSAQLEKAKSKYEKAFREAEKSLEIYKRAEADVHMTKADIEKTKQVMTSKMQISDDCKAEYAVEVQKTKEVQREHYENLLPQIFNQLQVNEEKRITKIQTLITAAADIERQVMPIITKCIDGMTTSATLIDCVEDSKLFISRYKTGFYPPNDVPFEDLSNTGTSQGTSAAVKVDASSRNVGTTALGKSKKRAGLLGIFGAQKADDVREDFGHLPPMQQKKQLLAKLEALKASLVKETSERDGMLKMQDIYKQNAKLGDPATIEKQLEENAQKLDRLRQEIRKFENFLTDADGRGGPNGVQDGPTPTPSPVPVRHSRVEEPERASAARTVEQYPVEQSQSQDQSVTKQVRPPLVTEQDSFDDDGLGTCVALYAFQATTDTALSMAEGETFEILERDEGDGWTHVQRSNGDVGFIPTSYVQLSYLE